MIIKEAKSEDLMEILEIKRRLFPSDPIDDSFKNDIDNSNSNLICLKNENEVIGYYDIYFMYENADIIQIAVKKEHQGNKYGSLLLEDLIKRAKERNVEFIHLEVKKTNIIALNLYKKFGFKEVRIRNKYYSDGEDAIEMVKGLD